MIEEYIISVPFLKSKFTHHNIKYSIGKLIDNIIIILKTGISYRDIVSFRNIYALRAIQIQHLFAIN